MHLDPTSLTPQQRLLDRAKQKFIADTGLVPVIGAEQEFYIYPDFETVEKAALFANRVEERSKAMGMPIFPLEKERGSGQYEYQLHHSKDIVHIATFLEYLRLLIAEEAASLGHEAFFDAKPFKDQPGSSLHIHLGLFDDQYNSVFKREGEAGYEEESKLMLYAVGGLLATMLESMRFFAPTDEAYTRFKPGFNAPINVSWGGNNRTVAVRIPASSLEEEGRHIEHRVSTADANPFLVIAVILAGAHFGLMQHIEPSIPKSYGDAGQGDYGFEPFFTSFAEAKNYNEKMPHVNKYLAYCVQDMK